MDLGSKYQRKLAVGLVLVSPLLVSPSLSAAQLERLEPNHGRVVSLEKQNLAATQNVAKALGLKPGNNVQKLKANQDKNGDVHVRYQQTYKGIPIWGKQSVLHRDKQGKIKRFGGTLVHDIGQDISNTTPQLSLERIRSKVQKPYLDVGYHIEDQQQGLRIYIDDKDVAHLAYEIQFFADSEQAVNPTRPTYLVDAKSGEVLLQYEGLAHAEADGGRQSKDWFL